MSEGPTGRAVRTGRLDESMTLITEMMERPLDPGYAVAAETRRKSGLPPATGHHSVLLVLVAVLIGVLLAVSALSLRTPTIAAGNIKLDLVARIEAVRAHADVQTRLIATLRDQIDTAQAVVLSQQSQTQLADELSRLEAAAGTVPVTGPGLVLTVDDAPTEASLKDVDPAAVIGPNLTKVFDTDLQIIVNGLWRAGAEAISINGNRLTVRTAIRSAGEAILVNTRGLTRPYVITAIGDPASLRVEFADNDGGSHLQSLKDNEKIRGDLQEHDSVVVPGEPALSLRAAKPFQSAVTRQTPIPTTAPTTSAPTTKYAPQPKPSSH